MAKIIDFPTGFEFTPDFDTDLDFIGSVADLIMEETEYAEVIIIAVREDNEIEVSHTEGNSRCVEVLDRTIEEQFLGEE